MVIICLLLAFLSVRAAAVQAFVEDRPELAYAAWSSHPDAMVAVTLSEIGQAAASGQAPDEKLLARVPAILAKAPLSAQPFLLEGTRALSSGDLRRADALLSEAASRDPRLPAARFLLAGLYLEEGRTREGLDQIAALIRRLPRAATPLVPSITAFARQPGAAGQVRAMLRGNRQLRDNVLSALAEDPANASLILELAGAEAQSGRQRPVPQWQERLLSGLVKRGDFRRAHALWRSFAGLPAGQVELFNPTFEANPAPPPFNWTLANGPGGVGEAASGGGLHLLFYGREDMVLASQTLLLRPGRYRLSFVASGMGGAFAGLSWTITCLPNSRLLAHQLIGKEAFLFSVPASGCEAQDLQLRGEASEIPTTTDSTIRNLSLSRIGA